MDKTAFKNKKSDSMYSNNYVHKSIVHAANIAKEKKYESKNLKHEYTFSPHTLYPLTDKPTSIKPDRPFTSKVEIEKKSKKENIVNVNPIASAFIQDRISNSIARHTQTPKEKYNYPMTSSQSYGWYSKPLLDNNKWNRPLTSTGISKYVSNYYHFHGINPFKLPSSSIKLK